MKFPPLKKQKEVMEVSEARDDNKFFFQKVWDFPDFFVIFELNFRIYDGK